MADRTLLSRATEGTLAPTPGYLYLDIAKNAASSPMACQEVSQYLCRRLQSKQNANIKYKCLKVIAKVAESPVTKGLFKRTMAQDSNSMSAIKEALQFRGPPDPARGDEPYQKVRTAAKEALDAIYSDTPTSSMSPAAADYSSYGASIAAGGPSNVPMTGPPGSHGTSKMEGIGNPMFKDPRLEQANGPMTAESFLRDAAEAVTGMIRDPLARSADMSQPNARPTTGSYNPGMPGYGSGGPYPPGRSQLAQATGGQWTMASNRGAAAVIPPANFQQDAGYYKQQQAYDWASKSASGGQAPATGVGGSWGAAPSAPRIPSSNTPQQHFVSATSTNAHGHGGTAVSDGQYEKQLIMELCPPGGLKAEPPPDKLQNFIQAIPSLDADLVCPALLDCLEEGQPWIIRAKALCVMEACITVGVGEDGVNKYADFFYECRGEVEPLTNHARPGVREPATRVIELLGLAPSNANRQEFVSSTAARSFAPPTAAPPPAPPADLLDFGDAPAPPQQPSRPPPPPAVPPSPPTSLEAAGALFGGLKIQDKVGNAPSAPPAESLMTGMSMNEASTAQTGTSFDFMKSSESATPQPAPAGSAFDFMQTAESSPPVPTPAPQSSFDFMQEPASTVPDGAAKGPSSSFDFMQADSTSAVTPNPTKATFDPLAQNYKPSPTSERTMMGQQQQLNPVQIQAMYAQQLMMQQQMQQMQFVMAMQQQQHLQVGTVPMPVIPPRNPVMVPGGYAATQSFSFLDKSAQPQMKKKEDKQFDFVQDAIRKEQK